MTEMAPALRLETYFDGKSRAWGVFQDRFGTVRRRFDVDIDGAWDGNTLQFHENFLYSDGETEARVWTVRPVGDDGYEGRTDGVLGLAKGRAIGNTLTWSYRFRLPIAGRVWTVRFDDWFCLLSDGVLVNRTRISKFGITLGEATIVFKKADGTLAAEHLDASEAA
jgi:hypothetical protein